MLDPSVVVVVVVDVVVVVVVVVVAVAERVAEVVGVMAPSGLASYERTRLLRGRRGFSL
jgi:hypothetical protein